MKNNQMSVIVTVYNIEQYIEECIVNILNQKNIVLELILVDDASTDNSLEICRKYEKIDNRVKVLANEVNLGITATRNRGLKAATGEYIYIMDGDDILKKESLSTMYNICKEKNLDLLEFSADVFYDNNNMKRFANEYCYIRSKCLNKIMTGAEIFVKLREECESVRWSACLHCYRGDLIREKSLYYVDGLRYADGSEFHLYMNASRAMCISDILYSRRVRPGSQITSKAKIHYLESLIILYVEELKMWDSYNIISEKINEGISRYFLLRKREILDMYQQFVNYDGETPLLDKHPSAKFFYNYTIKQIPVCIDKLTEHELERVKSAKKIYIYGAGFFGTELAKVFNYINLNNYEFIVTENKSNLDMHLGKRIIELNQIDFKDESELVVVAMSSINWDSIEKRLIEKNCHNYFFFEV